MSNRLSPASGPASGPTSTHEPLALDPRRAGSSERSALVQRSAIYAASNLSVKAVAFLALLLYARLLSPAEYGIWGLFSALANLGTLLLLFGLYVPASRIYFDEKDPSGRRRVYGTLFLFQVVGGAGCASLLVWLSSHLSLFRHVPSPEEYLRFTLAGSFFVSLNLLPMTLFRVRNQAGRHALTTLLATTLGSGLPVVTLALGHRTAKDVLAAWVLGTALMAAVYVCLLRDEVDLFFAPRRLAKILGWSLQFVPTSLAIWAIHYSSRLVLERLVPLSDVGIYTLGFAVASAVMLLIEGSADSWFTMFLRSDACGNADQLVRHTTTFIGGLSFLTFAASLCAPVFIRLVFPPSYRAAESVAAWTASSFLFYSPYLVFTYAVMSTRRLTLLPLVTLLIAGLTVLLNFVLVPRIGIVAPAAVHLVGYLLLAAANAALAWKVKPIRYDFRRWAAAIGTSLALAFVARGIPPSPLGVEVAWRLALLAAWPGLLYLLGYFSPADVEAARGLLRRWRRRSPA